MSEFEVDPAALRMTAQDVDDIAARARSIAARAADLAQTPVRRHFPRLPEAQRVAVRWEEVREAFADRLARVAQALDRLGENLATAGDSYETTDADAAERIEKIP